ncbi:MAG: bacillithiol biosynthesis BshC, partial [Gemmatimonadetes bacterium]|nr:bacillithiol biosynthesis BshC [Gemmatimonadota bacterium]NIS01074.1 bacillithiol biosynthesis BshC [Gemmatimonadota bacterium]NIU54283.1 bacillithiol biosynthesis BshC [Gemmatimonadota bacterium]NIW37780.1 bacillithiol biosynthesis BshC [Gemmatimonadota bacterium]NIY43515.1 bacillithiol biosynthesis BshC [Gemmatimonadota bacterium]
ACFYRAGPPTELDSYRRVAERIREGRTDSRWESLSELAADLEGGLPDRLARAIEGRGVFVATGQQAGLFVSPLFTLYKALTAVRLAQQLEDRLRLPVVPLFSVASEDHDWAEVDHTRIIDLENRLRRLSVDSRFADTSGPTPPVERIELGPDVEGALDELAQATPDTEFKSSVLTPLREAYRPGRSAAHAFQTALRHLLRRQEVMMVRTANPWVKRETRETLWRDWERREQSEARLLERSEALGAAGFEPQVPISAGTTNLFLEGALGRDRILHDAA